MLQESVRDNGASEQHSARRDPRTLTNLSDILSALATLESEEAELANSLADLLDDREPIIRALDKLHSLVPQIDELEHEASQFSEKVSVTAKTAERIGGRVRLLDEEMSRVRAATDRVGQVMELKSSLADLEASIESKDWESATRHCARAMSLPTDVIAGPFAEAAVPTAESPLPPVQTLQQAREKLLETFRQSFHQASQSRDSTATTRFFKLFPLIGWEEEGLDAYANFVVDLVRVRAPSTANSSSPLYYITTLTALFEGIAIVVDQHQPVVEKYYGAGRMRPVIARLLQECDRVTKGVVDNWEEERSMKRKLLDITEHSPTPMLTSVNKRQPSVNIGETPVDPREIDKVVSEAAGMVGRWSLFRKFLIDSLRDSPAHTDSSELPHADEQMITTVDTSLLDSTKSFRLFEWVMTTYCIPLELWYLRTSIDKAHRLSEPDLSQSPPLTTTPDDVFYILKAVMSRLLSTGSLTGVERTFEQLRVIMERDYIGVIKKKLDEVYRSTGPTTSVAKEKENKLNFMTMLNDIDISSSHLERLVHDFGESQSSTQHFTEEQQASVREQLAAFTTVVVKFRSAAKVGVEQLFNQLLRPKLRNLISDVYKDVSYVLDDDSYSNAEHQIIVRKRFVRTWENLLDGCKESFTENNFRLFFGLTLDVILRPWEKLLMTLRFTELGAIRFDRDLRSITTYLTSQTAFGDAREKFGRLQQFSTLLNLESEEDVDEFYNGSGITWKFTLAEARAIVGLKL